MNVGAIYKEVNEQINASIDFTAYVGLGDTITLVGVTAVDVVTGADVTSDLIAVTPTSTLVGNVVAFQVIDGAAGGARYRVIAAVVVSGANKFGYLDVFIVPSPIDLTTLAAVKNRAEVKSSADDAEIQSAITGFSQWLLDFTGRDTLNSVINLSEVYDGNGNARLFLRNTPILTLSSVAMNGVAIPVSDGYGSWGVYVERSRRSIGMRGGAGNFSTFPYPSQYGGGRRGPVFVLGQGNILVPYTAGYPAGTPFGLEYAVRCVVALNYKRKAWQDQKSRATSTGGASTTTTYRDWDFPPEYRAVFEFYQRQAIV